MNRRIEAASIERDARGEWFHPDMPVFAEGDEAGWRAWLLDQGLEVSTGLLEFDYRDEAQSIHEAYVNGESETFIGWRDEPPQGEGWFTLAIADTEDGPCWVWARAADAAETRDAKGGEQ